MEKHDYINVKEKNGKVRGWNLIEIKKGQKREPGQKPELEEKIIYAKKGDDKPLCGARLADFYTWPAEQGPAFMLNPSGNAITVREGIDLEAVRAALNAVSVEEAAEALAGECSEEEAAGLLEWIAEEMEKEPQYIRDAEKAARDWEEYADDENDDEIHTGEMGDLGQSFGENLYELHLPDEETEERVMNYCNRYIKAAATIGFKAGWIAREKRR